MRRTERQRGRERKERMRKGEMGGWGKRRQGGRGKQVIEDPQRQEEQDEEEEEEEECFMEVCVLLPKQGWGTQDRASSLRSRTRLSGGLRVDQFTNARR